eukprot:scaffold609756_cov41-Prasinocladus_malaysianus.AAC.1
MVIKASMHEAIIILSLVLTLLMQLITGELVRPSYNVLIYSAHSQTAGKMWSNISGKDSARAELLSKSSHLSHAAFSKRCQPWRRLDVQSVQTS